MERTDTQARPRISFDFTVNIPTLASVLTTVAVLITWGVHLSDNQENLQKLVAEDSKQSRIIIRQVGNIDTTLIILDQRLKAYPLHRHVDRQILVDPSTPAELPISQVETTKGRDHE